MEHIIAIPSHRSYGATSDGKIYDLRKEREIIGFLSKDGYLRVYLTNKDGTCAYSVSRLIAETFIPNPDNKPEVDHIDRNRSNNNASNLRWATHRENAINKGCYTNQKCIYHEVNEHFESYVIQVRNHKLKYKKRFDTRLYTLEQVKSIRNKLFEEHGLPITD